MSTKDLASDTESARLTPTDKILGAFRTTIAVIVVAGLAGALMLAQGDFEAVREAAEQGDATAQFNLGVMYAKGEGVPRDDTEAVRWYRQAAEQDHADAQFVLGLMYTNGLGVLKDDTEAVRWYRGAAVQDHADAQLFLGGMYAAGRGVLKDFVLAHMWFNIAGANGNEIARESRDNLERDMTRAEIARATELARACMTSDYQACEP